MPPATGTADSTSGATASGPDSSDSTGDDTTGGEADCLADLTLDETFVLLEGESTQVHAHMAFDAQHQGVWMAYTRRADDGSSNLATAIARIGCDGTVQLEPRTLSTSTANHNDPEVVLGDDRVLVIWSVDDGSGGDGNLDVVTRVLDRDGAPRQDTEQPVALTRGGAPFEASAWMVHAAAVADGTFMVAGTRAIEEISAFAVFVQRLDADGNAMGETIEPMLVDGIAHTEPRIAIADDGTAYVAWSQTADFSTYQVAALSLAPGAGGREVTVQTFGDEGDHPFVAAGSDPLWATSAAAAGGRSIRVWPAADTTPLELGEAGALDHTPALALSGGGGVVAWYRHLGGARNEVFVAGLQDVGTGNPTADAGMQIPEAEAAPYPLAITAVGEGTYLVAWSQGDNPDFIVRGRFVRP